MDLNELMQGLETEVDIIHPLLLKSSGVKIVVRSRHDPIMKELARRMANARMTHSRKGVSPDLEQLEEEALAFIVASVKSWSGVERDGETLECSKENVEWLFKHPGLQWIRKQVDEATGNEARFF